MNISFAVVFNFLLVTPRGKVVMSYLIGGFGGTVHVSILPVFWLLHFHGISGGDADISGRRNAFHKPAALCWNSKHICLGRNARFMHTNLKDHFGKGGGQTEEPDLGVNGEPLVGLQQRNNYD